MQSPQEPSVLVAKYLDVIRVSSERTAETYAYLLRLFAQYLEAKHNKADIDSIVERIAKNELNPFDLLAGLAAYLQARELDPLSVRKCVNVTRNFFEYNDIEISDRKYRIKVRLPRRIRRSKEPLDKKLIQNVLLRCTDVRLKTYLMFLAATGMRALEALSLTNRSFDFDAKPAIVRIGGKYTKTRTDRYVYLTEELAKQCKAWTDFKYRERRITRIVNGQAKAYYEKPTYHANDLFFALRAKAQPRALYVGYQDDFGSLLDTMGLGEREEGNEKRRKYTLHSFRRYVKTAISNAGYADFSEWFLGHAGSTYWRETEQKKIELFRRIENYLTYLDVDSLEAQGADIQAKLREKEVMMEAQNQRHRVEMDAMEARVKKMEEAWALALNAKGPELHDRMGESDSGMLPPPQQEKPLSAKSSKKSGKKRADS